MMWPVDVIMREIEATLGPNWALTSCELHGEMALATQSKVTPVL